MYRPVKYVQAGKICMVKTVLSLMQHWHPIFVSEDKQIYNWNNHIPR